MDLPESMPELLAQQEPIREGAVKAIQPVRPVPGGVRQQEEEVFVDMSTECAECFAGIRG